MTKQNLKLINSIILVIFLFFSSCGSSTESVKKVSDSDKEKNLKESIIESGKLIVGFEPDAPPVYFKDGSKTVGFDYDLIQYIANEVFDDVDIEVLEDSYDELPKKLLSGEIQILAGGRTPDDNENIEYTVPYLTFGYCLVTRVKDIKKYKNIKSISDVRIGVYDDVTADWVTQKFKNADITILGSREDEETSESDWMQGLVDREVDVIVYDYPFAANEIGDYNDELAISVKNINGTDLNQYVFGLNANVDGVKKLMKDINRAIKNYKQENEYANAIVKYLPNPGDSPDPMSTSTSSDYYVIKKGETLSRLAQEHLGSSDRWSEIYDLNLEKLASPDIIYPGQLIIKPQGWQ